MASGRREPAARQDRHSIVGSSGLLVANGVSA
jgi:hypothetical protein